jgi:hypothetical protein
MKLSLPCFVLLNKDSSHYIGEFVSGSLNNLFQMIHFETILEPYTFKEPCQLYLKDHQLSGLFSLLFIYFKTLFLFPMF